MPNINFQNYHFMSFIHTDLHILSYFVNITTKYESSLKIFTENELFKLHVKII